MKKKNFKNLKLNKNAVSSLATANLKGGDFDISAIIRCVTATGCPNPDSWGSYLDVCECAL